MSCEYINTHDYYNNQDYLSVSCANEESFNVDSCAGMYMITEPRFDDNFIPAYDIDILGDDNADITICNESDRIIASKSMFVTVVWNKKYKKIDCQYINYEQMDNIRCAFIDILSKQRDFSETVLYLKDSIANGSFKGNIAKIQKFIHYVNTYIQRDVAQIIEYLKMLRVDENTPIINIKDSTRTELFIMLNLAPDADFYEETIFIATWHLCLLLLEAYNGLGNTNDSIANNIYNIWKKYIKL